MVKWSAETFDKQSNFCNMASGVDWRRCATAECQKTPASSAIRWAASVISNPENGIITVRATGKQHEKIQEFISQVMTNSHRQVLIEATIVEVQLSREYQQGVNWSTAS